MPLAHFACLVWENVCTQHLWCWGARPRDLNLAWFVLVHRVEQSKRTIPREYTHKRHMSVSGIESILLNSLVSGFSKKDRGDFRSPSPPPERYVSSKNPDFSKPERICWQLFFFARHHELFPLPAFMRALISLSVYGISPFKRVAKNRSDSPETTVTSQGFWW